MLTFLLYRGLFPPTNFCYSCKFNAQSHERLDSDWGTWGVWQPHPSHGENIFCLTVNTLPARHSQCQQHIIYWDSSHTLDMEENTKQVSSSLEKCRPWPSASYFPSSTGVLSFPTRLSYCTQFANKTLKLPETFKFVFPWDFALHLGCLPLNLSPAFWTQAYSDRTWLCNLPQQPIHLHTDFT